MKIATLALLVALCSQARAQDAEPWELVRELDADQPVPASCTLVARMQMNARFSNFYKKVGTKVIDLGGNSFITDARTEVPGPLFTTTKVKFSGRAFNCAEGTP